MSVIDYSQYSLFNFCPWAWFERYVGQRQMRYTGQRSDPLCLGSLVHNALDNFSKFGKPFFDEECIIENTPTPDTVALAELLVQGYLKKYPKELWPVEATEQPLQFPLVHQCQCGCHTAEDPGRCSCWRDTFHDTGANGLAKLDGYFYVPEDTQVPSGIDGYTLTLSRGWWAREYKTKAHGRNRAEWIKEWQTKRQADFQILALQNYLNQQSYEWFQERAISNQAPIQGVLVRVLEKPHEYTPKRKCARCKESYELSSFIPKDTGFMCPVCGMIQELSPYIPKSPKVPDYFSITVTRKTEQLEVAKWEILSVARRMEDMRVNGIDSEIPNRDACVNNVHRRECEYHAPHTYGNRVEDDARFVKIDATKYMGIPV